MRRLKLLDMMQNKFNWVRIGDYITLCDETNASDHNYEVIGINREKEFMPTVANIESLDLRKYKIVRKGRFVFSGMQTGRDICIRIALYDKDIPALISPAYTTFTVNTPNELLPEFLFIYFLREEMDRYGWFISDSSVRANLDWNRFLDIRIPLPSIDEQKRIVETWKKLRMVKEQNEAIAEPLFQLCQSKIQNLKHTCQFSRLGNYICERNERNSDNRYGEDSARGVNTNKEIQSCKRLGEKLDSYKIICPRDIVYNCNIKLTQSTEKLAIALFEEENKCIVTNFYTVFYIKDHSLIEEFLMLWLVRDEFARYVKFMSCSSVRDRFDLSELQETYIPIPSIEIQRAIVNIYKCAKEAKRIAEEADKLSRELCPALIQKVIHA